MKIIRWALVLGAMALVVWMRMLPLALPVTADWADALARSRVRSRVAQEVQREFPPAQWTAKVQERTTEWIDHNQAQFQQAKERHAQRLKSRLRFTGEDGRDHVFLGDLDSYAWLRTARNYLRSETTCDEVVNGECRDTYTNAPVGTRMIYHRSMHIVAIVVIHKIITLFSPGVPLSSSSYLVPVLLGMLGVLPAFFIGRLLAGTAAGLVAAILIGLEPTFLQRTMGSDNDIWNVVLPLFMMWAAISAMRATHWRGQVGFAAAAAAVAGLHAATWKGWIFAYFVLLAGLVGNVAVLATRTALQRRSLRVWENREVRSALLVAGAFYVCAWLFTYLAGSADSYVGIPTHILGRATGWVADEISSGPIDAGLWPNVFRTVGEVTPPNLGKLMFSLGGRVYYFAALLGLALMFLPKKRLSKRHALVLICSIPIYAFIGDLSGPGRLQLLVLIALPPAAALVMSLLSQDDSADSRRGAELIIMAWFLAAIHLSLSSIRFILLLGPAFGFAFAVSAGRLYAWLGRVAQRLPARLAVGAQAVLLAMVVGALAQPVYRGYVTARQYTPKLTDAWWHTLRNIRDTSSAEAIINTWWDYGYWIKYVAQRRVLADGGTLSTHVHHWFSKALVTADESESVGILRMLNCGSDASPAPEGARGAYGKVLSIRNDPLTAYETVRDLVRLDRRQAAFELSRRGFTPSEQIDILRSTHCDPPEAYLILTTDFLRQVGSWVHFGFWEPRRAYIVQQVRKQPRAAVVADMVRRFGYTREKSASLYAQIRARTSQQEIEDFIAPRKYRLSFRWHRCRARPNRTELSCPLRMTDNITGIVLHSFQYTPSAPAGGRLRIRKPGDSQGWREVSPAGILLAGPQRLQQLAVPGPGRLDFQVLIDVARQRVLIGSSRVIRSMLTRLMFLYGRYSRHFKKFNEQQTYAGERIMTWKVAWKNANQLP